MKKGAARRIGLSFAETCVRQSLRVAIAKIVIARAKSSSAAPVELAVAIDALSGG